MRKILETPRKHLLAAGVALAMASTLAVSQNPSQDAAQAQPQTAATYASQLPNFRQLIQDQSPAVVSIRGTRGPGEARGPGGQQLPEDVPEPFRRFFEGVPQPGPRVAQGSGFIISADGYILTNAHVVDGSDEVNVRLHDNRELSAKVVGSDERADVAVLKVEASDLPTVSMPGDGQRLQVGDWVLAIGSPFGFDYSASQGIVSALGRSLPDGTYVPFIQTDVAVNPGNSGGPLFDLNGNVVGINSQIYSRSGGYQGLSFAIPIKLALNIADQIRDQGYVSRGWLGVMIQDLDQALSDSFGLDTPRGALVSQVMDGSPAAKAGIQVGDVILSYDGQELQRSSALPPLVGTTPVDSSVKIEVLRDGKPLTLDTHIAELEDQDRPVQVAGSSAGDEAPKLGVAVAELNDQQRQAFNVSHGVLINQVEPGSPAARAGLQDGDVILSLDRKDIESVQQLVENLRTAPTDRPVVLLVKRENGTVFVPVRLS